MNNIKLKLIVAVGENMGIGINGDVPWRLKNEMAYFSRMTRFVRDPSKENVVLMGRRSWDCIPDKYRPLPGRINFVLTRSPDLLEPKLPKGVRAFGSLDDALAEIARLQNVENVWVIGGTNIYQMALNHPLFYRLYMTQVKKHFECDTFFPQIDLENFKLVQNYGDEEPLIPIGKQTENGLEYYCHVYEKS